jgi:hypothetical protein
MQYKLIKQSAALLAVLLFTAFSCTTAGSTVTILGTVQVFGSEPHTDAGLAADDGKIYAIYPAKKDAELRQLQGRLAEFKVQLLKEGRGEGSLYLRDGTVTPISWKILD